jgi:hypothetical protein
MGHFEGFFEGEETFLTPKLPFTSEVQTVLIKEKKQKIFGPGHPGEILKQN